MNSLTEATWLDRDGASQATTRGNSAPTGCRQTGADSGDVFCSDTGRTGATGFTKALTGRSSVYVGSHPQVSTDCQKGPGGGCDGGGDGELCGR